MNIFEEEHHSGPDYLAILQRRKWLIIILVPILLIISLSVIVLLPPSYRSSSTILVETQQIPQEMVRSTITSVAAERIQVIKQRVMTREKLLDIAKKYDLFDKNESQPVSLMVDDIRKKIHIDLVTAGQSKRQRSTATIAFTITYEDRNPNIAQAMVSELVTLFLDENVKSRIDRATETSQFFSAESEKLKKQLDETEALSAEFKQENKEALPEHLNLYMDMLTRIQARAQNTEREYNSLEDLKNILEVQLSSYQAQQKQEQKRQLASPEELKLAELKIQYRQIVSQYLPTHPNVVSLRKQIAFYEARINPQALFRVLQEDIRQAETELESVKLEFTDRHPDVKQLQNQIKALKSRLTRLPETATEVSEEVEVNPIVLEIQAKISSSQSKMESLKKQRNELHRDIKDMQERIIQIPQVERGLKALNRDYINTKLRYDQMSSKEMEAKLSESLEEGRKAERFSILEPPLLPDKPHKPNRKKLTVMGVGFSLLAPLGLILLWEMMHPGIRGSGALASILKERPLVVIPYIQTEAEVRKRKRLIIAGVILLMLMAASSVAAIHFFYQSLDAIWYKVLYRLAEK